MLKGRWQNSKTGLSSERGNRSSDWQRKRIAMHSLESFRRVGVRVAGRRKIVREFRFMCIVIALQDILTDPLN